MSTPLEFGFTLMSEEHGPKELVGLAQRAERVGFGFLVQSDHFHPWVPEQRHSPYAWAVLGAVATALIEAGYYGYSTGVDVQRLLEANFDFNAPNSFSSCRTCSCTW